MSSHRNLLLLGLLLLAGVGAFAALDDTSSPAIPPPAPIGGNDDGIGRYEAARGDADLAAAEWNATNGVEREAVSNGFLDPSARGFVLQAWDRHEGVPAANAEVHLLDDFDEEEWDEMRDRPADGPHWADLAAARGQSFRADATGRVKLPAFEGRALVTAELPGAFGLILVEEERDEIETLLLERDQTVTVRVVDDQGRPVQGVPVGILQLYPDRLYPQRVQQRLRSTLETKKRIDAWIAANPENAQRAGGRTDWIERRLADIEEEQEEIEQAMLRYGRPQDEGDPVITTNPELEAQRLTGVDGLAVFRHFQFDKEDGDEWWPVEFRNSFEAALLIPQSTTRNVPFQGDPVPEDVIELRLPPTGRVVVRTVDRDGRPFVHPVNVELIAAGRASLVRREMFARKDQGEPILEFEHVGLGIDFLGQCELDDDDFEWGLPLFAGPQQPGETVSVDLVVAPEAGMLYGRLVDPDGRVLDGREATFLINAASGRLEGEEIETGPDGGFHLPYRVRRDQTAPFRFEVREELGRGLRGLTRPLEELPLAKVTDMGDLMLGRFAVAAEGVVVNDAGEPIEGASIRLQRQRDIPVRNRGRDRERPGQTQQSWTDEAFVRTETDEEGRYTLFADLEEAEYQLRFEAEEHFGRSVLLDSDDLNEPIQLTRTSRLLGEVLVPDWLSREDLRVELIEVSNGNRNRDDRLREWDDKRWIFFDRLRAGTYEIRVRARRFPDPLLVVSDIGLKPGQRDIHPKLEGLDLRNQLYEFRIKAQNEAGEPVSPDRPLLAEVARTTGELSSVGIAWEDGEAVVVSSLPQLRVVPFASGFRAAPVVLGPGESTIRFDAIPPIELYLPGLASKIELGTSRLRLEKVGNEGAPTQIESWDRDSRRMAGWFRSVRVDERRPAGNDRTSFNPTTDGLYKVTLRLDVRRRQDSIDVDLGEIDVRREPGGAAQKLTLQFNVAELDTALLQVQQARAQREQLRRR